MHLCCFSLIPSEIFQLNNRLRYQFVGEVMTDILSTKMHDQTCDPWDSQGNEKRMQFAFPLPDRDNLYN